MKSHFILSSLWSMMKTWEADHTLIEKQLAFRVFYIAWLFSFCQLFTRPRVSENFCGGRGTLPTENPSSLRWSKSCFHCRLGGFSGSAFGSPAPQEKGGAWECIYPFVLLYSTRPMLLEIPLFSKYNAAIDTWKVLDGPTFGMGVKT